MFHEIPLRSSYSQLIHLLNDKTKETIDFTPDPDKIKLFQQDTDDILSDNVTVVYTNSKISEIIAGIKMEMLSRLNIMINEITYGKIPRGIFNKFQDLVNLELSESNPTAISALNIAVESLGNSEDPERISTVAHTCKRLIKSVADNLFPVQKEKYHIKDGDDMDMGEEKYFNRLMAFVHEINSKNKKELLEKIFLLKNLYGEIPESMNKGTHQNISNQSAEMLVIYCYLILGEIILEKNMANNN